MQEGIYTCTKKTKEIIHLIQSIDIKHDLNESSENTASNIYMPNGVHWWTEKGINHQQIFLDFWTRKTTRKVEPSLHSRTMKTHHSTIQS